MGVGTGVSVGLGVLVGRSVRVGPTLARSATAGAAVGAISASPSPGASIANQTTKAMPSRKANRNNPKVPIFFTAELLAKSPSPEDLEGNLTRNRPFRQAQGKSLANDSPMKVRRTQSEPNTSVLQSRHPGIAPDPHLCYNQQTATGP